MKTTLQLAKFDNNRDIDYEDMDREFAAILPTTVATHAAEEFCGSISPQVSKSSDKPIYARQSRARNRFSRKLKLLGLFLLVCFTLIATIAVLFNPYVNNVLNTVLSNIGIFTKIKLIDASTFLTLIS